MGPSTPSLRLTTELMHVEPCYELNCVPPKRYVEANPGSHECELVLFFKYFILAVPCLSCGTWDFQSSMHHAGSLVAVCELLSSNMWGLVPRPGIEPLPWECSLSHWTTREVPDVSLFGNRIFAGDQIKMRSLGSDTTEGNVTYTERRRASEMETETGVMSLQANECQGWPATSRKNPGEGDGAESPSTSRTTLSVYTFHQISSLWNCEKINLCLYKLPGLKHFVTKTNPKKSNWYAKSYMSAYTINLVFGVCLHHGEWEPKSDAPSANTEPLLGARHALVVTGCCRSILHAQPPC